MPVQTISSTIKFWPFCGRADQTRNRSELSQLGRGSATALKGTKCGKKRQVKVQAGERKQTAVLACSLASMWKKGAGCLEKNQSRAFQAFSFVSYMGQQGTHPASGPYMHRKR